MPSAGSWDRPGLAMAITGLGVAIATAVIAKWSGPTVSIVAIATVAALAMLARIGQQSTRRHAVGAVAVGCAVALVTVSVLQFRDRHDDAAAKDQVAAQGGGLVADAFSYGSAQQRNAKADRFTGAMAVVYRSQMQVPDQLPDTRQWQLARSAVVSAHRDRAVLVVAANVTEQAAGKQSSYGRVVEAHLRKVDGQWRIANVDVVV